MDRLMENDMMTLTQYYADGRWLPPYEMARYKTVDPSTGRDDGMAFACGAADVDLAVQAANRAFPSWSQTPVPIRLRYLAEWEELYRQQLDESQQLITREMGGPISFTAQTQHPLRIFRYYRQIASGLMADTNRGSFVMRKESAGVVAIITPWNMPHKTVIMKAVPALAAGCTVIVKPAPQTPFDAARLAEQAHSAGLPPGVFNVLPGTDQTGYALAQHRNVDKVAFTGSVAAGARVAAACAARIGRVSLELGGKSPMIVTQDADLDAVTASLLDWSLACNGQICSNQTRILAHQDIAAELEERVAAAMEKLVIGNPLDPDTQIGPLVSHGQLEAAVDACRRARAEGARHVTGAARLDRPGWFMSPGLFSDVDPDSHLFQREVFAPVLTMTSWQSDEQAVAMANYSDFGLDAAVWSGDLDRARAMARAVRSGTVRINGAPTDMDAPLGGFRQSGYGRELGPEGMTAFTEPKVIAGSSRL